MLYNPKWKEHEVKEDKFGFDEYGYPRCPSALIRHGLECLERRYQSEKSFKPSWCDGDSCLAGTVFYWQDNKRVSWANIPTLDALSSFAYGCPESGFEKLSLTLPSSIPRYIRPWSGMGDANGFLKEMNNIADMLEAEGF